jgi:hypothetical protein
VQVTHTSEWQSQCSENDVKVKRYSVWEILCKNNAYKYKNNFIKKKQLQPVDSAKIF